MNKNIQLMKIINMLAIYFQNIILIIMNYYLNEDFNHFYLNSMKKLLFKFQNYYNKNVFFLLTTIKL